MNITYEHMLQFIVIAKSRGDIHGHRIDILEQKLTITYTEYVKSQMHLNVISGFYQDNERSIFEYANALDFIEGDSSKRSDALKVLNYFYTDMSDFLLKNDNVVYLDAVLDIDLGIDEISINYQEQKNLFVELLKQSEIENQKFGLPGNPALKKFCEKNPEFLNSINWENIVVDESVSYTEKLKRFEFAEIIDYCNSVNFFRNLDNFLYAAFLLHYAKKGHYKIEVIKL